MKVKLRKAPENRQLSTLFDLYGSCGGCGSCGCSDSVAACVGNYEMAVRIVKSANQEANYRNNYGN